MIVPAPAKINLFLELLGKRADGFHELETVMVPISIFDSLRFRADETGKIRLIGSVSDRLSPGEWESVCQDQGFWGPENLIAKAARLLQQESGTVKGVTISVYKRIPAAAGLGGASSNAAATLKALNKLWQVGLPGEKLSQLAAQLGSDIPFFLQSGGAICRGRGEQVCPIHTPGPISIVVCKPPIGHSTAAIYGVCRVPERPTDSTPMVDALEAGDVYRVGRFLNNRLEAFAGRRTDWIDRIAYQFSQVGSLGHQMSGSGSSYFGIFANQKSARRAKKLLSSRLPGTLIFDAQTLAPRSS